MRIKFSTHLNFDFIKNIRSFLSIRQNKATKSDTISEKQHKATKVALFQHSGGRTQERAANRYEPRPGACAAETLHARGWPRSRCILTIFHTAFIMHSARGYDTIHGHFRPVMAWSVSVMCWFGTCFGFVMSGIIGVCENSVLLKFFEILCWCRFLCVDERILLYFCLNVFSYFELLRYRRTR